MGRTSGGASSDLDLRIQRHGEDDPGANDRVTRFRANADDRAGRQTLEGLGWPHTRWEERRAGPLPISIWGPSGPGKTTLERMIASHVSERMPTIVLDVKHSKVWDGLTPDGKNVGRGLFRSRSGDPAARGRRPWSE